MSNFKFPSDEKNYSEINNIKFLLALLRDEAQRETSVKINPFILTTYKKYGYVKKIVAKCKYCEARLEFKGIRTESDHFRDQRFNHESTNSNPSYEKVVNIVYKLTSFNNSHEHNRQHATMEERKRKNRQRNELILDFYQSLLKDNASPNLIKSQIRKKFGIDDKEIFKIVHPFENIQRRYTYFKQNMKNMNFTIIEKFSDLIDINKVKSNFSSYIDFPNEFTVITPCMVQNFLKYGTTIYFGVYPQYISQSKKLILVGGFYGINEHHIFIPFATVILTVLKKEQQMVNVSNLLDIIDKEDDDIVRILMSIFRTFFSYYNTKIKENPRNLLLVVRQTNNTQAAIYQMRKEFPNLNFIYCFREKLNALQLQVNKRYCNDSYSSEQKLDFITALYSMVKTLDEEEYNSHLKNLFKKANTNNTLLLQKITEDSHLFCFSKIKDTLNNLYEQCIDEELKRKYENIINTNVKSQHMFMNNILQIINATLTYERKTSQQNSQNVKKMAQETKENSGMTTQKVGQNVRIASQELRQKEMKQGIVDFACPDCEKYRSAKKHQFFNEIELFELRIPQLKKIRQKVCIKTYCLIMKQLVKCMSIKSMIEQDDYNQRQYFVFKNGIKFNILQEQKTGLLQCDCEISKKYGIPCSHELFICVNKGISIEKQIQRWII